MVRGSFNSFDSHDNSGFRSSSTRAEIFRLRKLSDICWLVDVYMLQRKSIQILADVLYFNYETFNRAHWDLFRGSETYANGEEKRGYAQKYGLNKIN